MTLQLLPPETPIQATGGRCGWVIGCAWHNGREIPALGQLVGDRLFLFAHPDRDANDPDDSQWLWEYAYRRPFPQAADHVWPDGKTRPDLWNADVEAFV